MKRIAPYIGIVFLAAMVLLASLLPKNANGEECFELEKNVDYDALEYAVAMCESMYCTDPNGVTAHARNNCHSIMTNDGELVHFSSKKESAKAFISLWIRKYGDRFPTHNDAVRYSGNEDQSRWLPCVKWVYNENVDSEDLRV